MGRTRWRSSAAFAFIPSKSLLCGTNDSSSIAITCRSFLRPLTHQNQTRRKKRHSLRMNLKQLQHQRPGLRLLLYEENPERISGCLASSPEPVNRSPPASGRRGLARDHFDGPWDWEAAQRYCPTALG